MSGLIGAGRGERAPDDRPAHRNGYRPGRWDTRVGGLGLASRSRSIASVELPFEESVQIVAHAVEGIFHNCGLSFQTVPEGIYISVDAPSR